MIKKDVIIIGGGIAGISAGYHLQKRKINNIIFESKSNPGGHIGNFTIQGFRFDNAIHVSFTNNDYVRKIFDKVDYLTHESNPHCLEQKRWMRHPVQNNLYNLPDEEKVELLESFLNRPSDYSPKNFYEWLITQYGEKIALRYPIKYTKKYWGMNAETLGLNWVQQRFRSPKFEEILSGAIEHKNENHWYAGGTISEVRYPVEGGYYEFVRPLADNLDIRCDSTVKSIDIENKTISLNDDSIVQFKQLISTVPLPKISKMIKSCPKHVLESAEKLLWTTVDLISVGLKKPDVPPPYLWWYIYDEENLASRGYSPSLKSPNNAPPGCSSLQFEIYNLSTKEKYSPKLLIKNIKKSLLDMNICDEKDIIFIDHKHLPFGNVAFYSDMESDRKIVSDYLEKNNIFSCGRFGEWDYFWSDESFMSGKNAADKVVINEN
tara:strand:- start:6089 stop:7390 length:1302 start_codon:yes stop_codon:yes gene_type:complete